MAFRASLKGILTAAVLAAASGAFAQAVEDPDVDFATELFDLSPGSWEVKATFDDLPAPTSIQMCVDDSIVGLASLISSRISALGDPGCKMSGATKTASGQTFKVACERPNQSFTIYATATRVSAEHFTLDTVVNAGATRKHVVNQIKRAGACLAGQEPGDMTANMEGKIVAMPSMLTLMAMNGNEAK